MDVSGCHGEGYLTRDGGFVLKSGATISSVQHPSCPEGVSRKRQGAIETGKVVNWVTLEDMEFTSTSYAAAFVLGRSQSGPKCWKNSEGVSLGELRKEG